MTGRKLERGSVASHHTDGIHHILTWPLIVGLLASSLFTLALAAPSITRSLIWGCRSIAEQKVRAAEARLGYGDLSVAEDLAHEALSLAPNCHCAHLVLAKVHREFMKMAEKKGDEGETRYHRQQCYDEASKSISALGEFSEEIEGLMQNCSIVDILEQT